MIAVGGRLAESLGQVHWLVVGQAEVAAVFPRKLREGAFDAGAFGEVMAQLDDDCGQGLWTWLPLTSALAARTAGAYSRLLGRFSCERRTPCT